MPTDFPTAGEDMKITLRNSNYPQFDRTWAERLKSEHPDIWDAGGNIRGDMAYVLWGRAIEGSEAEGVLNWIKEREAWAARHYRDFRLAGVVAQIKWGVIGSRGESYMKDLINSEIDRRQNKSMLKEYINEIDAETVKALSAGRLPDLPEIDDLAVYMAGFVQRNLSKACELPSVSVETEALSKAAFQPIEINNIDKAAADFQGFVIGIVLEPGREDKRDMHGQWMSKEEIYKACLNWSTYSQKVGIQHTEWAAQQGVNHPDFVCVWNWIEYGCPVIGGYEVKPGTWLQAYQAVSERGMQMLKNYQINGLSPGGLGTVWKSPAESMEDYD
jgi:hypothetical protein